MRESVNNRSPQSANGVKMQVLLYKESQRMIFDLCIYNILNT
jgi:hypothetical protein